MCYIRERISNIKYYQLVRVASKTVKKRLVSISGIMLFLVILCPHYCLAQFITLKPGFESAELQLNTGLFKSELVAIRFDPLLWEIKIYQSKIAKTAVEVCQETKSAVAINANFFGTNLEPLGLIISDSSLVHPLQLGGRTLTGVFVINKGSAKILHRDKFQLSKDISQAIQAGPRLITEGREITIPEDSPTRRSAIAIDNDGRVLMFASKDRFPGLSLKDLQSILMRKELKIRDALNLDGGSSSQLCVSSTVGKQIELSGGDKVPVFLVVKGPVEK